MNKEKRRPGRHGRRKAKQTGLRIYEDQLDAISHLCATKYRGRRTMADVIRQAIDEYLDKENQP